MEIKITPSVLSGRVNAPASKSYAHRYIILSCLSGKEITVKNVGKSKDVYATAECMKSLGADSEIVDGNFTVKSFSKKKSAKINCGESGSTLRFLLPVCAALGIKTEFLGSEKLLSRPSDALISVLNEHGASIKDFKVSGEISAGKYVIDGSISSQYVSGLLMALSVTGKESEIVITGNKVSTDYINITVDVMRAFDIETETTDNGYKIFPSAFRSAREYVNEGDYSGAAFMLAAGAIGGEVSVCGLLSGSKQGDAEIINVIKKFGASVSENGQVYTVKRGDLKGIECDCENIPDLAQIISVIAAFANGKTVIKGVGRLKYKESDRLKAITEMLTVSGIKWETDGKTLSVYGGKPKGGVFDSNNDHRTAMSCAILAAFSDGESVIKGAEAVSKSYPDFYEDYKKLGGKVDVIV